MDPRYCGRRRIDAATEVIVTMFTSKFSHAEPTLMRCLSGRWLAVSDQREKIRIAVEGSTEAEARSLFHKSMECWELLWTDDRETGS